MSREYLTHRMLAGLWALLTIVAACSGGGGGSNTTPAAPPQPSITPAAPGLVSVAFTFSAGCSGVADTGTLYGNAEVEPQVAINPANPNTLIGTWQQDRWSNGGSQGIKVGYTLDSGATWSTRALPISRCGGGIDTNGGDYERASDPWVTFSPNGVAYQMSLAISGTAFQPGSASALLVMRSADGGRNWTGPITLLRDGSQFFNDKNAITADPTDSRYVYGVWDRLTADNRGPTLFARTTDGGLTWEPARAIYDPGVNNQTIGNIISVLPNGTLINFFTQLNTMGSQSSALFAVMRSTDKGLTWSQPIKVADFLGIGTRDPETGTAIRDSGFLGQISAGAAVVQGSQGQLFVTWQDARFNSGARDAIAFSRSADGGLTWSAPVRINGDINVQALVPSVNGRADGTIGFSYYDMRSNTADPATLLTDYWLATSSDGVNWTDRRISAAFNLAIAPIARGYFMGDYQGLVSAAGSFYPFYVRTNGADISNRTDVFFTPITVPLATGSATLSVPLRMPTTEPPPLMVSAEHRQRVHQGIVRKMEQRIPGWAKARGITGETPESD